MKLKENNVIVFFGDSVTDTCHNVNHEKYPYGSGYVMMVDSHINTNYPQLNVKMINQGINGHRTKDLLARVDQDVNLVHPDFIFILIGVNDAWRRYDFNDPTSIEQFVCNYKGFLDSIKKANPQAQIVLMTPYILPSQDWVMQLKEDLDEKVEAILNLAKEYNLPLIPLHEIIPHYANLLTPKIVSGDGIHPSLVGHSIIATQVVNYLLSE